MARWSGVCRVGWLVTLAALAGTVLPGTARAALVAQGGALDPAYLDKLLAPVALYPDQLLAQMLLCSGNSRKVGELSAWLKKNSALKGSELQKAAEKAGFEPSFVALVPFPQVIDYMAGNLTWTSQLGGAFATDKGAVFDAIQRLRKQSQAAGNLKSSPQQTVETQTTKGGEQVIVIEPANPQVVYVPQYNPDVVYTSSTVVVQQSSSSSDAVAAGLIGFTAGIAIGAAFDNDYYYGPYGWGRPVYMYNDAWDDWYDNREDAREDWMDHREDMGENRSERAEDARENRTDRSKNAQEQRTERSQNRTEAAGSRSTGTSASATAAGTSQEARGYSRDGASASTSSAASRDRSGTKSDAFSGYSSGKSERAASQRGKSSRGSSRSSGGRRR